MFGIESEVTVGRTPQGVEVSFGTKPEVRYFDSEDGAQKVLGRERFFWAAAFAISTGLTLAGLNSINAQVQNFPSMEVVGIFKGLVEMFVGAMAIKSTIGEMEQRNQAMYLMHNYHFP